MSVFNKDNKTKNRPPRSSSKRSSGLMEQHSNLNVAHSTVSRSSGITTKSKRLKTGMNGQIRPYGEEQVNEVPTSRPGGEDLIFNDFDNASSPKYEPYKVAPIPKMNMGSPNTLTGLTEDTKENLPPDLHMVKDNHISILNMDKLNLKDVNNFLETQPTTNNATFDHKSNGGGYERGVFQKTGFDNLDSNLEVKQGNISSIRDFKQQITERSLLRGADGDGNKLLGKEIFQEVANDDVQNDVAVHYKRATTEPLTIADNRELVQRDFDPDHNVDSAPQFKTCFLMLFENLKEMAFIQSQLTEQSLNARACAQALRLVMEKKLACRHDEETNIVRKIGQVFCRF